LAFLLDTNVLIRLRDRDLAIVPRIAALDQPILISNVSRVELEGGVQTDPQQAAVRRIRMDAIFQALQVLSFGGADAEAYGAIVQAIGYSRRKLLDRMIAAQAIVNHAALVTQNPADFRDIPGLELEAW
jgi:predicted nucleic acid-binding protein